MNTTTNSLSPMGGIVLSGGNSRRMGLPKSELPFGSESMLQRVVRIVTEMAHPVFVVTAADYSHQHTQQAKFGTDVGLVHDRVAGRGPLEGLAVGLQSLGGCAEWVFVTSCDTPLVSKSLLVEFESAVQNSPSSDVYVVRDAQRVHPFPAIYRSSCLPVIEQRLSQENLRMSDLLGDLTVCEIVAKELSPATRLSLLNVNRWDDYVQALELSGNRLDPQVLRQWQSLQAQQ